MKLGLLGGTFDPIHRGHLDVARAAADAVQLDQVWLVTARNPPHRRHPDASAADRFAMVALAAREEGLVASDIEMHHEGPSYTVETLGRVRGSVPADTSIFFLIGADAFRDVPSWRAFPDVLDRCHFVVVSRPGLPASSLRQALPALASRMHTPPCPIPATPSIFLVDAPTTAVSSTDVRRRLREGASVDGLVPPAVAAYIADHRLYQGQEPRPA